MAARARDCQAPDEAFERVQLWDDGADGDGKTAADNTLFAVQGIFIP